MWWPPAFIVVAIVRLANAVKIVVLIFTAYADWYRLSVRKLKTQSSWGCWVEFVMLILEKSRDQHTESSAKRLARVEELQQYAKPSPLPTVGVI
jgi:hypothetical protein